MTTAITIGMIIIYVAIMMGIGVYTSKQAKSVNDFVLGGRNVGSWLTAFAYGTSYFSAVVFIGYAGQFGWSYGVSAAWVGVGNALLGSALAWVVLGKRTRIMTQSLGAKTMPEYFELRWHSKGLKIAAAIIVFVFLIPYTASVYNGLSRLFNMAFQIESEGAYKLIIVVMAMLTAIYVILGGYAATAINDFIQGIVMLLGIAAVVYCAIHYQGGLSNALAELGKIEVNGKTNTLNSIFGPDPLNLFGVVILTSLGTWGLPQMVHKFYAIKSEKEIGKGAVISTFFALIVAGGSYLLGGFDRLFCTLDGSDSGKAAIATLSNGDLAGCAAGSAHRTGGCTSAFCIYVYAVLTGADLQFHADHRPDSPEGEKDLGEKRGSDHACADRCVPPDLRFYRLPQERLHLYPDVLFLGRTGRRIPRAVYVWTVQ